MAVIGSDGLSLLIGDGAATEMFSALKGAAITRMEITQRPHVAKAVTSDAWNIQVGMSERQITLDCDAYATDEANALRLKTLAMNGAAGNFKLQLRSTETLSFAAVITKYREEIRPGEIKKLFCRLETSGAAS